MESSGLVSFFSPPDASSIQTSKLIEATVNQANLTKQNGSDPPSERSLKTVTCRRCDIGGDVDQTDGRQNETHSYKAGCKSSITCASCRIFLQEKDAKEDVILPYEKSQSSSLGEIHYVRDSEEDYDSDEDPDDDLDI